jgi:hypothetical protein
MTGEGARMNRSEKELRRIAEHIVTLLPEDADDARRACELAMELKQWEDEDPPGEIADAGKLSILPRK